MGFQRRSTLFPKLVYRFQSFRGFVDWRLSCGSERGMRYYMHDGPAAFRFELAGDLDANDATRLEQDWRTASSTVCARTLIIDVSWVTAMDEAVRGLFRRWYAGGAKFAARSKQSRELVESVTGHRFIPEPARAPAYRSWLSKSWLFRKSMPSAIPVTPLLALLIML